MQKVLNTNLPDQSPILRHDEVLFVSYDASFPDRNGGTRVHGQVISALLRTRFPLLLAQGNSARASEYPPELRPVFHQPRFMKYIAHLKFINYAYFNLWLCKFIMTRSRHHRELVFQANWGTIPTLALMRFMGRSEWVCILVDSFTTHSAKELNWSSWELGLPLAVVKRIEKLATRSRFITVVNRKEADTLVALGFGVDRVRCIPLAASLFGRPEEIASRAFRSELLLEKGLPSDARLVAFHGHLSTPANKSAVERILNDIAPRTYEFDTSIIFLIIGEGYTSKNSAPNVRFLGFVNDLRLVLSNVDIVIAPLEFGSGLKNKILDALGCGTPVITTRVGSSGFESHGSPMIVSTIPDFPQAIVSLLKDPNRVAIGRAGMEYVKKYYPEELLDRYTEIANMLVGSRDRLVSRWRG